MAAQENAVIVRTVLEAFNARDFDAAAAFAAPDVEIVNTPLGETWRGPEGMRAFMRGWADAFPDARVEVREVVATDDRVVVEFTGRGTHTGTLAGPGGGLPPTGRPVEIRFCDVWELRSGRVVRSRSYYDLAGMLRQLGAADDPAVTAANLRAMLGVYEAFRTGDLDALDELVAEDLVEHEAFPGVGPGREGLKQFFTLMRTAFPDLSLEVHDLAAHGDRVFARLTMHGTHLGEWPGMPPTGRAFQVQTVDVVRFEGGRGVEHWGVTDQLGMLRQLGALPEEAPPADRRAPIDLVAVPPAGSEEEERNRAVVRGFIEGLNARDPRAIDAAFSPDIAWHGGSVGEIRGIEPFRALLAGFYGAFPDLRLELHDLIAEGDRVAARITARGTHRGDFQGIPPTGRQGAISGNNVYRLEGGRIVEEWWAEDMLGLFQQLGAVPLPAPPVP